VDCSTHNSALGSKLIKKNVDLNFLKNLKKMKLLVVNLCHKTWVTRRLSASHNDNDLIVLVKEAKSCLAKNKSKSAHLTVTVASPHPTPNVMLGKMHTSMKRTHLNTKDNQSLCHL
jgi:hypothetical protein